MEISSHWILDIAVVQKWKGLFVCPLAFQSILSTLETPVVLNFLWGHVFSEHSDIFSSLITQTRLSLGQAGQAALSLFLFTHMHYLANRDSGLLYH